MNSDFENYEDDDVIAAVLAFMLLKKFKNATQTKVKGRN